jgi:hypothetical protein
MKVEPSVPIAIEVYDPTSPVESTVVIVVPEEHDALPQ